VTGRFGPHGRVVADPGQGDALTDLLLDAADLLGDDPSCQLYVVSRDVGEPDVVWVTEVWADRQAHASSLEDPRVRALIGRARPLIAQLPQSTELRPVGGKGL
jgi:quinol monooxygenase YgiN